MDTIYTYRDAKQSHVCRAGLFKYYRYELKGKMLWYYDEYLVDTEDYKINNEDVYMSTGFNHNWDVEQVKAHLRKNYSAEQLVSEQQWHQLKNDLYLNIAMSKHMVN